MCNKKINFILPFKPRRPAGGFRVMYEYANRLAKKGYCVHLTFPIFTPYMNYRLPYFVRLMLSKLEGFGRNKWFDFDPSITMSYVPRVEEKYIPDADIVIATWWSTVLEMGALSPSKGRKINLIQGFENWEGHEDLLYSSYNIKNTTNIVVASYLKDIVSQHTSNRVELITNGIDNSVFHITKQINARKPSTVAMLYSEQEIKGSKYGLEALKLVKERVPELEVELFGISPPPDSLPGWIKYNRDPADLCSVYNGNAIFISNSFTEGFGLVSVEAMLCGCALVCTNIDGHKEYAFDGKTALLTEVRNPEQMAEKIISLIENTDYRIKLAQQGHDYAQIFDWKNSIEKMEAVIKSLLP
ncbi:glycosyltransferase involved in cell wall biosynthesis [Dysgonomonas sp. PH5-45]|uniref:glycosyltransferase family 4 protein n=1 Tax=unclassified Dysgonomonas TaxID=2630389 RepID=UPI00247528D8|nr:MULTISPECIES: glycosyltransferase family 4 protein [unclassified Dysgonomonas]MDH6354301.1 glycosyltransferase involved in cell wall biosynthesis [Dysgonomonas sp. PH5-45]MDH6387202.1 glycosyltransferase involved in cell wall biosynthesis [Dysgonomonas sp. PH5-37]